MEIKVHELKTDPDSFGMSIRGEKPWEIRFDDRGFKVGDLLHLRETRHTGLEMLPRVRELTDETRGFTVEQRAIPGAPLIYTGREILCAVTGMLRGPVYGLKDGWVIMSVQKIYREGG